MGSQLGQQQRVQVMSLAKSCLSRTLAFAIVLPLSVSFLRAQAPGLTTLYSFTGQDGDGASPYAGVVLGPDGSLYGTTGYGGTFGAGVVYQLSPPTSGGAWTESVLYSFTGG